VDDAEFRRRLDAHMERGNELMERGNELMARNRAALDDNSRAFRDLSHFLAEQTHALRLLTREFVDETRAQRQALFRMLDRLDERGGEAPG
jgi:hypothetical protein